MRILSILQYSPPSETIGGAERQMHSIHKGLISKGLDIQVLADVLNVGTLHQVFEGVPIWGVKFPILARSSLLPSNIQTWVCLNNMLKLIKMKAGPFDLIQVTPFRETALWGFWLSSHLNIPWIGRIACSGSYGDFNYISKYMSRNSLAKRTIPAVFETCAAAIAVDQETYKEALVNGFRKDKVVIIPSAIVLDDISSIEEVKNIPEGGVLIYLGRIAVQKRIDDLVKAYAICKQHELKDKAVNIPNLDIVGNGDDNNVREIVAQLGIEGNVRLYGQQKNVEKFFKKAICMINASESEGMPNAVLEACAYGVPAILSDIPAHREIAKHIGMAEFLFPVGNQNALSEKILNYLSLEKKDAIQKRIRCFRYAQGLTKEKRNEAYLDLYDKIMKRCIFENELDKKNN